MTEHKPLTQLHRARYRAKKLIKPSYRRLKARATSEKFRIRLMKRQRFSPEEASGFLFFQFNSGNAKYFVRQDSKLRVHISDTPHYSVAKQSVEGDKDGVEKARDNYIEYLKSSWPSYGVDTSDAKVDARYRKYLEFIDLTARAKKLFAPVMLTRIPGRQSYYVVDGNHRCATASALGLPVSAKILGFPLAFDRFMRVDVFYGTKHRSMPYQSIYIDKSVVRHGRRDDIYDRLALLPAEVLEDKTILDVGSNMGMGSIAALKFGAKKVVGLEVSRKMINFSTRFAVFDECYHDVEFRQFDIDNDLLPKDEKYDVAFMMSVHNHVESPSALAQIARDHVAEAVVFEGHPHTDLSSYKDFIDGGGFSKIDKVADLGVSVFDRTSCRPLWIFRK